MSRLISDILGAPEPHFSHTVKHWEQITHNSGHDNRLLSDITLARKQALSELKLDHDDTTPKELFYALRERAASTNLELQSELEVVDTDSPEVVVQKIVSFIDELDVQREVWTIKHAVVKQLLIKHVPKKTLKLLGLRSIDSVLKRSSACELLVLAYQIETQEWVKKMHGYIKKLKPTDFQSEKSRIHTVGAVRVERLRKAGINTTRIIIPNYETGTILAIPPAQRFSMDVLAITLTILESLNQMRVYSAYYRMMSMRPDFGARLHALMHEGLTQAHHDHEMEWSVLQKHFNHNKESFDPIEQPHLQYDDIVLSHPLHVLTIALPTVQFWSSYPHVFMTDGSHPVSLHLLDVVTNASNQLPYEHSVYFHLQQQIWEDLRLRYLRHDAVQAATLRQFEDALL